MAYDEKLAARIRECLTDVKKVNEKEMFGGICFMVNAKMCVGVVKDEMMCRIDPSTHDEAIEMPGCRTMDFTGRPMKGYVFVDASGMKTKAQLNSWVKKCLDFNSRAKSSRKKTSGKK